MHGQSPRFDLPTKHRSMCAVACSPSWHIDRPWTVHILAVLLICDSMDRATRWTLLSQSSDARPLDRRLSVTIDNTQQSQQQQQQLRHLWHPPLTFHAGTVSHTHTGHRRRCRCLMAYYYVRVNERSCANHLGLLSRHRRLCINADNAALQCHGPLHSEP